jgi:uncharacterized protein (TIGR03663 family)
MNRSLKTACWLVPLAVIHATLYFYQLGSKALHHDESLHAYYAWQILREWRYDYLPMMHGPLQLYLGGILAKIFGDTEAIYRLLSALSGFALPLLAFVFFRREKRTSGTVPDSSNNEPDKDGLSTPIALVLAIWLSFSAPLLYYARFYRNDVFFAFLCLVSIGAALQWWRNEGRSNGWIALSVAAAGLLMSVKENSIIFYFTLTGAGCLWLASDPALHSTFRDVFSETRQKTQNPKSNSLLLVLLKAINAAGVTFFACWGIARLALPDALFVPTTIYKLATLGVLLFLTGFFFCVLLQHSGRHWRGSRAQRLCNYCVRCKYGIISGFLIAGLVYMVIFTNLFREPQTPFAVYRETFEYWLAEHKKQRLKGPFHYYLVILALYHLPALLLVLGATFWRPMESQRGRSIWRIASVALLAAGCLSWFFDWPALDADHLDATLHMTSRLHVVIALWVVFVAPWAAWSRYRAGRPLHGAIALWALMSFFIYSYAGEKAPWVVVHITLPLLLWAAFELQYLLDRDILKLTQPRHRQFLIASAALVLGWSGFNAVRAVFWYPSNPRERLVYNHTSEYIKDAADFALMVTELEPPPDDTPITDGDIGKSGTEEEFTAEFALQGESQQYRVRYTGDSTWPLAYHFRNSAEIAILQASEPMPDVLFIDYGHLDMKREWNDSMLWLDVPFRQYYTPPMLPLPRMVGLTFWTPHPDSLRHFYFLYRLQQSEIADDSNSNYKQVGFTQAWSMLGRYYFLRDPFFDRQKPGGVWGAGKTAQVVRLGINPALLNHHPELADQWHNLELKTESARLDENWINQN